MSKKSNETSLVDCLSISIEFQISTDIKLVIITTSKHDKRIEAMQALTEPCIIKKSRAHSKYFESSILLCLVSTSGINWNDSIISENSCVALACICESSIEKNKQRKEPDVALCSESEVTKTEPFHYSIFVTGNVKFILMSVVPATKRERLTTRTSCCLSDVTWPAAVECHWHGASHGAAESDVGDLELLRSLAWWR